jgi:hypothetical protein
MAEPTPTASLARPSNAGAFELLVTGLSRAYYGGSPHGGWWVPVDAVGTPFGTKSRRYLVVVSRVVVVPPSRSVSVFVWVSVLPPIPSRWTSFSMTVLPFLSTSLWIVVSR